MCLSFVGTSGQSCVCQSRFVLPRTKHDEIVERLVAALANVKVGDPHSPVFDDLQVDTPQVELAILGREVELHRAQPEPLYPLLATVVGHRGHAEQRGA